MNFLKCLVPGNDYPIVGNLQTPPNVALFDYEETDEEHKPLGDFVGFIELAVNTRARSILEPLISQSVEFLPVNIDIGSYYELNVDWIDCLDISSSVVIRFRDGGIMDVEQYAFNWEHLRDINMFHIKELRSSKLFVSNTFRRVVEANDLRGLIFYPVNSLPDKILDDIL